MGNSASTHRDRIDNTVDFGSLKPFGTYTGPQDWNHEIVAQLIKERRLAPFYWPLEDYEDDWTDEQIMAARKVLPEPTSPGSEGGTDTPPHMPSRTMSKQSDRSSVRSSGMRIPEAQLYRGAVECPICFLYYPPNTNRSRCCDHYICTECFVQIKRADPTPQHIVSEPAACPYCVQDNFGIIYTPPPWRAGIASEGYPSPELYKVTSGSSLNPPPPLAKQRRKSISHTSPEVVTIDQIRPDWEQKLAAVRAAVARRANRRIIMRQVGDRLIPVGISSGRGLPLQLEGTDGVPAGEDAGGRRRRHDLSQLLGSMGMAGQDLEELMVLEAMRLSLLEHEQAQRRQQEQEGRGRTGQSNAPTAGPSTESGTPLSSSAPSGSRTPAIPISSRVNGSGSRTPISSSVPNPLILGSSPSGLPSLLGRTGSPRTGSPLPDGRTSGAGLGSSSPSRASFADDNRSPPAPLRPSSEVIDHSQVSSLHRAAVTAANAFLSSSATEPTSLSTMTSPNNHALAVMTASPTALSDAMSSSLIGGPSLPEPLLAAREDTIDSVRTDVSEDGGGTYEPLMSPDSEESERLLDRSMSTSSEQHRPDEAGSPAAETAP